MHRNVCFLFAFIALMGMINCFILEPALAGHEETVCMTPDGCDDCMVCCSFNHQIIPSITVPFSPIHEISLFIETDSVTHLDSPSFSIFHPPLAI